MSTYTVGSRVQVLQDPEFGPGPWPSKPTGRITPSPTGEPFGVVETRQGPERMWWVTFDEPQRDTDGEGPYSTAQVLERYLQPAE